MPVADVLGATRVAVDQEVTVRGWVRLTAEIQKLASPSSPFMTAPADPVQAVINNSLPNYNEEVLHT